MGQQDNADHECSICGSTENLTYAIITQEPLEAEGARTKEAHPFCSDHIQEIVEKDEFYVRELPPMPEKWGGFTRNEDEDGEILYDHEISTEAWIKFDPNTDEIELTEFVKEKD